MGDSLVDKYRSYNYRTFESPKEQYQATVLVCIWNSFHWSRSFSIWCLYHDSNPLFQHQSGKSTCNSTVAKCSNENGNLCFRDPVSWNQLVLCKQVNWCLEFQGREKDFITAHLGKLHNVAAKTHQNWKSIIFKENLFLKKWLQHKSPEEKRNESNCGL